MTAPPFDSADTRHATDLAPAERLLFASLQAWAKARLAGEAPHRSLAGDLRSRTSSRVAALFIAWIQAIEAASLRPLQAECPHCQGASSDLQRLIIACGMAPVAFELGQRLLEPLVSEPQSVMLLGRALNTALATSGWPLPVRLYPPTATPASRGTIH